MQTKLTISFLHYKCVFVINQFGYISNNFNLIKYMALYYDLPVFRDVYRLVIKIFEYTKDFPREYKYTLGQDLKRDSINLIRSIYRANKTKDKLVYLEAFLDDFELVKFELRLSADLRILPLKKHAALAELLDTIGKQITGWRNAQTV